MWVRVSNACQDPLTSTALAQDQVVRVVAEDNEWYSIETLEGEKGRLPRVLGNTIANPLRTSTESVYCSIAPFGGQRDGDLTFTIYTILVVESVESEGWLKGVVVTDAGKRLGQAGSIPNTYVKQLAGFKAPPSASIPSSFTTDFSSFQQTVSPYARAVYPFKSEFPTELSFVADEIIQLRRRVDTDWLEGTIGTRSGIFPASFVQIVVPLEGETTVADSQPSPSAPASDGIGFAVVRHDFDGRQKDELSVKIGDSIRVIRMANNDWVECRDPATDSVGIVPVSFLELYLDDEEDDSKMNTTSSSRPASGVDQSFSTLTNQSFLGTSTLSDWRSSTRVDESSTTVGSSSSFSPNSQNAGWATFGDDWLELDKKSTPPARPPPPKSTSFESANDIVSLEEMFRKKDMGNGGASAVMDSPDTGSDRDKRNKVLEELISTELQFVTDVNAFTDAVEGSSLLTHKQKAVFKSGCAQITQLAGILVQGLLNEQAKDFENQAIGSCFLSLRKSYAQTYGYYFRNIEQINALMTQASSDTRLEEALNDVVRKMQSQGAGVIDSTTAVSRPIQRCVKYPLFLSELAKYTPITHSDHPKLMDAVKQMSTLGQKMNESKRRKELSQKYSEDQPSSSIGDMLSKLTIHSIKKKSNRFTYRMGSSIGMVKVSRDAEFDALVNELDACERRLVRFNYTLVIYKKKIFFETRQLIQKKLIDISERKRKISVVGTVVEREVTPFQDEIKIFADMLNTKVRDEIVKALRAIPKKLIKKRNDKLMDWEAVKSANKSITIVQGQNNKYLDYEALNTQVKQTVPKVIEVLHKVLREAMETVRIMDANLMMELKKIFTTTLERNQANNLLQHCLIVPDIICFVDYYDPQRLFPLQAIVTKAERKAKNHAFIAAGVEKAGRSKRGSLSVQGTVEEPATINYPTLPTPTSETTVGVAKFRSQTAEERRTVLEKADAKNRRHDMFRAKTDWPSTKELLEENRVTGTQLIVKKGDAVLVVQRHTMNMCLAYNGYYNAKLSMALLEPWYNADGSAKTTLNQQAITRPHSTPPKQSVQQSVNLIDLDDSPTDAVPCLTPNLVAPLVPTPLGASTAPSASASSLLPSFAAFTQSKLPAVPATDLFNEMKPINWGNTPALVPSSTNPFGSTAEPSMLQKTPSLPSFCEQTQAAFPSPAFPVTFDESPTEKPKQAPVAHLPPPIPSSSGNPSPSPATGDNFSIMWEQIKSQPLSKRSESPKPLIPTRPEAQLPSNGGATAAPKPPAAFDFAQFGAYDTVPSDNNSLLYSNAPGALYSNLPAPTIAAPGASGASGSAAMNPFAKPPTYDAPPSELYAQPPSLQYDFPPLEPTVDPYKDKPSLGTLKALFDFVPQDPNQIPLKAGEQLQLLQEYDDYGCEEWLLVRPTMGKCGYVPANYCSPK